MAAKNERREAVETALIDFLTSHEIEAGVVDEIVLEYVISVLEEVGTTSADSIDVEGFMEMMDAYYPGFSAIQRVHVFEWIFSLSSQLVAGQPQTPPRRDSSSPLSPCQSPSESHVTSSGDSNSQVDILMEMFPSLCRTDVRRCLRVSNGNRDHTIDLLIQRCETVATDDIKHRKELGKELINRNDDKLLKEKMVERYAFEMEKSQNGEYKPAIQKQAPKKMVRYFDSKIVNTKGERFMDTKKEESEEMKKTYVNLKPARKYRFH